MTTKKKKEKNLQIRTEERIRINVLDPDHDLDDAMAETAARDHLFDTGRGTVAESKVQRGIPLETYTTEDGVMVWPIQLVLLSTSYQSIQVEVPDPGPWKSARVRRELDVTETEIVTGFVFTVVPGELVRFREHGPKSVEIERQTRARFYLDRKSFDLVFELPVESTTAGEVKERLDEHLQENATPGIPTTSQAEKPGSSYSDEEVEALKDAATDASEKARGWYRYELRHAVEDIAPNDLESVPFDLRDGMIVKVRALDASILEVDTGPGDPVFHQIDRATFHAFFEILESELERVPRVGSYATLEDLKDQVDSPVEEKIKKALEQSEAEFKADQRTGLEKAATIASVIARSHEVGSGPSVGTDASLEESTVDTDTTAETAIEDPGPTTCPWCDEVLDACQCILGDEAPDWKAYKPRPGWSLKKDAVEELNAAGLWITMDVNDGVEARVDDSEELAVVRQPDGQEKVVDSAVFLVLFELSGLVDEDKEDTPW